MNNKQSISSSDVNDNQTPPNTNHTNLKELSELLKMELIPKFTDDYLDEWTSDSNDIEGLHKIIDDFADQLIELFAGVGAAPTQLTASQENRIRLDIKNQLPKGELNSMYHDLYSGHTKEWTEGFRTGYNMCYNFVEILLIPTQQPTTKEGDINER